MPGRNLTQLCMPKCSHCIDCAVLVYIYLQTSMNTTKTLSQDIQQTVNTVFVYNITMHHSRHLARVMAVLAVKPLSRIRNLKLSYKIQVSWCGSKYFKCPWMNLKQFWVQSLHFSLIHHRQSVHWLKPPPFWFTAKHSMNTVPYTQRTVKQYVVPLPCFLWCVNFQYLWSVTCCCELKQWQTCPLWCCAVLQLQNDVTLPGLVCNSISKFKL